MDRPATSHVRRRRPPLSDAEAPTVAIDATPNGVEGTTAQLTAVLTGGTYDGDVAYAWTVSNGTLNNPALASPTWTRPNVAANTNVTAQLTVTVSGTGTNAADGTSDTATDSDTSVVLALPDAVAPAVSIGSIPNGNEGTTVQLTAQVTGGTYDGNPVYLWSGSGAFSDTGATSPVWTRPQVAFNSNQTVQLQVTVTGSDGIANAGTSDHDHGQRNVGGLQCAGRHDRDSIPVPAGPAGHATRRPGRGRVHRGSRPGRLAGGATGRDRDQRGLPDRARPDRNRRRRSRRQPHGAPAQSLRTSCSRWPTWTTRDWMWSRPPCWSRAVPERR